jgi:hypothetical protein
MGCALSVSLFISLSLTHYVMVVGRAQPVARGGAFPVARMPPPSKGSNKNCGQQAPPRIMLVSTPAAPSCSHVTAF